MSDPFAPPQQRPAGVEHIETPLRVSRIGVSVLAFGTWAAAVAFGVGSFLLWHILVSGRYETLADAGYGSATTLVGVWLVALLFAPFGFMFWPALAFSLLAVCRRQFWYCLGPALIGFIYGWSWPPTWNAIMAI